ncbi:F-box/LRR-repeat protein 5 isoform X2 [Pseudoliparis swirei]|uniref:F-box/LRR-repeat protein 5 isoform X2 n=1 Tax=Pseudoliparis swirei TaxID=2059687 RepID=UPI0024BE1E80|nr:F-box/LRR-repeat protein 5 isoform X2 [Pseudoliparis swirei]
MAPFPDEVDVFTGPHWRMKQLVGLYCEKLSKTNFSNHSDFRSFLQSLCATFKEFKMHERIENECIIGLLQQRCCTVYNVHSDNKLSEMLSLFEKGLHNVKSEYEQLNYARQLKERLEAFTQDFLPHMKEEEEVFQPMLMQYFSYEELKDIKKQVVAQHSSQQHRAAAQLLKGLSLWSQAEELHKALKYADHEKTHDDPEQLSDSSAHISDLPTELLLRLLRYLGPEDLCRCSQVCSSWLDLTRTGSLWRHLYPVRWARGDYYSGPPGDRDQEPGEEWVRSRQNEGRAYQEWDEDADVDESDESGGARGSPAIDTAQREKRLLNGLLQNLLPAVGPAVRSMVLAYSSTVSSKMVRQILSFCPNIRHLDLTQTDVTDCAFDSWAALGGCLSLEHLDLSGCEKLTDHSAMKLSVGLGDLASSGGADRRSAQRAKLLQSSPVPIALTEARKNPAAGRQRRALVFKPPGAPTRVWVLDLADIEDAADWSRGGAESFAETQPAGGACCCRRPGGEQRTGAGFLQYAGVAAESLCGHSACCAADVALRTFAGPPGDSGATGLRTERSSFEGRRCPEREDRAAPTTTATRSLRFLSLSGCYQVTDLGLRALSQRGGLPHLEHLNLSGCLFITAVGLRELVSVCPALNDEHFYYCDNISGNHGNCSAAWWLYRCSLPLVVSRENAVLILCCFCKTSLPAVSGAPEVKVSRRYRSWYDAVSIYYLSFVYFKCNDLFITSIVHVSRSL